MSQRGMRVCIDCRSRLLAESLERFLGGMVAGEKGCDLIVADHPLSSDKPVFRIGLDEEADLRKPFSRSQLMIRLEEFWEKERAKRLSREFTIEEGEPGLEERIEEATRRFVEEIVRIVKEEYGKRA
ncbi:hypothetical protein [Hydrogenimonas sp.]